MRGTEIDRERESGSDIETKTGRERRIKERQTDGQKHREKKNTIYGLRAIK